MPTASAMQSGVRVTSGPLRAEFSHTWMGIAIRSIRAGRPSRGALRGTAEVSAVVTRSIARMVGG
jgi:hypothetical protein